MFARIAILRLATFRLGTLTLFAHTVGQGFAVFIRVAIPTLRIRPRTLCVLTSFAVNWLIAILHLVVAQERFIRSAAITRHTAVVNT
jgi:hypothetical protein